jgi:hypothetical protein
MFDGVRVNLSSAVSLRERRGERLQLKGGLKVSVGRSSNQEQKKEAYYIEAVPSSVEVVSRGRGRWSRCWWSWLRGFRIELHAAVAVVHHCVRGERTFEPQHLTVRRCSEVFVLFAVNNSVQIRDAAVAEWELGAVHIRLHQASIVRLPIRAVQKVAL